MCVCVWGGGGVGVGGGGETQTVESGYSLAWEHPFFHVIIL